ncbi:hypothetical protein X975_03776, partial [Stegodyphus mimosarum]
MSFSPEEEQIRCTLHWFHNWNNTQRKEFLDVLKTQHLSHAEDLASSFESLKISRRSPSVFECQLKQFSLWFDEWSMQGRRSLFIKLLEVDQTLLARLS